ncbi:MAG: CopG family ribbon-helix-helix protein, partial [bacterium]
LRYFKIHCKNKILHLVSALKSRIQVIHNGGDITMITLRLDKELEQKLTELAQLNGLSRSELIRRSIKDYVTKLDGPTAWDLGEGIFGKYSSGDGNLSRDRKQFVKDKIRAKR